MGELEERDGGIDQVAITRSEAGIGEEINERGRRKRERR
jgi:hypothetical protein